MLLLELVAPATFFLWLGVSALLTALASYLVPALNWQAECLIFSVLAVLSIWLSRRYLVHRQTQSELPHLNRRAQQYVGRVFILTEAIENGIGEIVVDDARWQVRGPPLPKGATVNAVACEGNVLIVQGAQSQ